MDECRQRDVPFGGECLEFGEVPLPVAGQLPPYRVAVDVEEFSDVDLGEAAGFHLCADCCGYAAAEWTASW